MVDAHLGLRAIYGSPRTSRPAPGHRVYPYLWEKIRVTRPNRAWAADISYLAIARGFLYLVAIMDWHSRYVVAWRWSNTLEADFCIDVLKEALGQGLPEVLNTDQSLPRRRPGAANSPAWNSPKSCGIMG